MEASRRKLVRSYTIWVLYVSLKQFWTLKQKPSKNSLLGNITVSDHEIWVIFLWEYSIRREQLQGFTAPPGKYHACEDLKLQAALFKAAVSAGVNLNHFQLSSYWESFLGKCSNQKSKQKKRQNDNAALINRGEWSCIPILSIAIWFSTGIAIQGERETFHLLTLRS